MKRRDFLGTTGLVSIGLLAYGTREAYDTIDVPRDYSTIQEGVAAAKEGDLILVGPGTYAEAVSVRTPGLTIRGRDRNEVVLDGEFERGNGFEIEADGVAVENLTLRHFEGNGVYWRNVEGFRGSYLTAYNNGYYGVYAYGSRDGRFEYSYASGHPDAGFYLGRNQPYEAVVSDVVAEHNAMGYSGTSTGGDLTIRDSVWRHNMAGIVPNTLDEHDSPQHSSHIVGNEVYANHNEDAPSVAHTYPTFGTGIALWGGNDNLVEDNVVEDHENFGIVAHYNVDEPSGNVIRDNEVHESGVADLALGTPAGVGNEFENNEFDTSMPESIEADASTGDDRVAEVFEPQQRRADEEEFPGGDYREQPEPDGQETMDDPEADPIPAAKDSSWGS